MVAVGARRAGMGRGGVGGADHGGLAFAYTLELPQKLAYEAATWTQLQHSLYRYVAVIGGWRPSSPLWCSRCGPVSVEQHLAGVGGWLLGVAHRDRAANRCAMAPVAVPVNRWTSRRAWPEARLITGNSIEVIPTIMSWAYACGQRKRRLDAPPAAF